MIDKKQIMLGNVLYWQGDEIGKVEAILQYSAFIRDKEDTLNEVKYHRLEPISLTPEILERCMARTHNGINEIYVLDSGELELTIAHDDIGKGIVNLYTSIKYFYLENIKYLHQLQNLYFALTGQELTLNSK